MNGNETRTLWISVGAALFAVFLLYSYTEQKSREVMDKYGKKSTVVMATRDINEMETIDITKLDFSNGQPEMELKVEKDIFILNGDVTDKLEKAKPFMFGINKR